MIASESPPFFGPDLTTAPSVPILVNSAPSIFLCAKQLYGSKNESANWYHGSHRLLASLALRTAYTIKRATLKRENAVLSLTHIEGHSVDVKKRIRRLHNRRGSRTYSTTRLDSLLSRNPSAITTPTSTMTREMTNPLPKNVPWKPISPVSKVPCSNGNSEYRRWRLR